LKTGGLLGCAPVVLRALEFLLANAPGRWNVP
jgi:hypothetical protein